MENGAYDMTSDTMTASFLKTGSKKRARINIPSLLSLVATK
jgi:hypothetical protein